MSWHGSKQGKSGSGRHGGDGSGQGGSHGTGRRGDVSRDELSSLFDTASSEHGGSRGRAEGDREKTRGGDDYRAGDRRDGGYRSQAGWGRSGNDRSGKDAFPGMTGGTGMAGKSLSNAAPGSGSLSKFAFLGAIGAVLIWSLLAWAAYGLVDGLGGWLTANTGALLQGGKDVIGTVGIAKDVVDQVDMQGTTGLLQQFVSMAVTVARPAIIVIWFLGALAILAVPFLLRRLGGLLRSRRH